MPRASQDVLRLVASSQVGRSVSDVLPRSGFRKNELLFALRSCLENEQGSPGPCVCLPGGAPGWSVSLRGRAGARDR